jgi:hypothetical protein
VTITFALIFAGFLMIFAGVKGLPFLDVARGKFH